MISSSAPPTVDSVSLRAWEAFRATAHFGSLDGLRCLSILAVIWHHGPGISRPGLAGRGNMGVPLFFAISGFLITTLLLREQQRKGVISLKNFYLRRSLRIFPLYFTVLGVYCVMAYAVARNTEVAHRFFANVPYFLTYTSNWFVGTSGTFAFAWSLAAEEQFYSTWPSVLRFLRPSRATGVAAVLLLATMTWSVLDGLGAAPHNFGFVILKNVPMAICWGCLLALALHNRQGFALLWKVAGHPWTPGILLSSVVAILAWFRQSDIAAHFLFAALVVSCVIRENHILALLLRQRLIVHLGMISYGMYLMHGLVYDALGQVAGHLPHLLQAHSVGGFFLTLTITAVAATISFRYYETPFLRMKSRFAA